jgi:acetyl-CoA carboxylase beta subunit
MTNKPTDKEEQFFKEQELLIRLQIIAEEQRAMAAAEKQRLKEWHWIRCPKCGQALATEKYGTVDVDVCAGCKGLWLDAHELDAILASTQKIGPLRSFLKILGR